MELTAQLVHGEAGRRVVEVRAYQGDRLLGSALGEAADAEAAEDRARQRLLARLVPAPPPPAPSGASQSLARPRAVPASRNHPIGVQPVIVTTDFGSPPERAVGSADHSPTAPGAESNPASDSREPAASKPRTGTAAAVRQQAAGSQQASDADPSGTKQSSRPVHSEDIPQKASTIRSAASIRNSIDDPTGGATRDLFGSELIPEQGHSSQQDYFSRPNSDTSQDQDARTNPAVNNDNSAGKQYFTGEDSGTREQPDAPDEHSVPSNTLAGAEQRLVTDLQKGSNHPPGADHPQELTNSATSGSPHPAIEPVAGPLAPPQEPLVDPEDWSSDLAALELHLRRLGWDREREAIYLKRAFGHPNRNRLTNYGDLRAYLHTLDNLPAGSEPTTATVPLRRSELLLQCDALLAQLGWNADQGRDLLERELQATSRQQLNDQQLLHFNMLLESELLKSDLLAPSPGQTTVVP